MTHRSVLGPVFLVSTSLCLPLISQRAAMMETELVFNYLLEMEAIKDERIIYVRGACDRFFDEQGNFHLELFDKDMLHMSHQGYQVWNKILSPYLE